MVEEVVKLEKTTHLFFLGERRPTAEAARLVNAEATSPTPGASTWAARCNSEDRNALSARTKQNPKPTHTQKQTNASGKAKDRALPPTRPGLNKPALPQLCHQGL